MVMVKWIFIKIQMLIDLLTNAGLVATIFITIGQIQQMAAFFIL